MSDARERLNAEAVRKVVDRKLMGFTITPDRVLLTFGGGRELVIESGDMSKLAAHYCGPLPGTRR